MIELLGNLLGFAAEEIISAAKKYFNLAIKVIAFWIVSLISGGIILIVDKILKIGWLTSFAILLVTTTTAISFTFLLIIYLLIKKIRDSSQTFRYALDKLANIVVTGYFFAGYAYFSHVVVLDSIFLFAVFIMILIMTIIILTDENFIYSFLINRAKLLFFLITFMIIGSMIINASPKQTRVKFINFFNGVVGNLSTPITYRTVADLDKIEFFFTSPSQAGEARVYHFQDDLFDGEGYHPRLGEHLIAVDKAFIQDLYNRVKEKEQKEKELKDQAERDKQAQLDAAAAAEKAKQEEAQRQEEIKRQEEIRLAKELPPTSETGPLIRENAELPPIEIEKIPIEIPARTLIRVATGTRVSSDTAREGDLIKGSLAGQIMVNDQIVFDKDCDVTLEIIDAENADPLRGGKAFIAFALRKITEVGVKSVDVDAEISMVQLNMPTEKPEGSKGKKVAEVGAATIGGAIIGGILGGKKGAIIGGSIGAAGGTAAVMAGGNTNNDANRKDNKLTLSPGYPLQFITKSAILVPYQ